MEIAPLLYREVLKIHENEQLSLADKVQAQHRLLIGVFLEATSKEKLHFTTMFARIAFVCHKHHFSNQTQFYIHTFRRVARKMAINDENHVNIELEYQLGLKVLTESILILFKTSVPPELANLLPPDGFYRINPVKIVDSKAKMRVVLLEDIPEKEQFLARTEEDSSKEIFIKYNIPERNANFNPTIKAIRSLFAFPLNVNLLEVEIDDKGVYRPKGFVVEPDYLIDVTAIAECVKNSGTEPLSHLLKRFLPMGGSTAIMLGNIANFFLDALIVNPAVTFEDTFRKVFAINPLQFCLMTDDQIRQLQSDARTHFYNLKLMVMQGFEENKIVAKDCFLEPSFYSETYGIQGRLDLFYSNGGKEAAIVELKSGKTFRPNIYGINHNHFTQTLLYDLLVRSAFQGLEPMNYILYSLYNDKTLRYAPTIKSEQLEAIQVRNQLVAIEQALINMGKLEENDENPNAPILHQLRASYFEKSDSFTKRDVEVFEKVYFSLSDVEKAYFNAFSSFIAREQKLAKTGQEGVENANGLASLWLDELSAKEERFDIISHLHIKENLSDEENPLIFFAKTEKTSPLANFRRGDVAVLYPFAKDTSTVLQNQIFRCTVLDVTNEEVTIRLRAQQSNVSIFEQFEFWNIEKDLIDKSFGELHRSLFTFAQSPDYKKNLLLGILPPALPAEIELIAPKELTDEQQLIFKKIIAAQDYFLLWGPPGTGKTSMMLKHLVEYLLYNTQENLLLLAYTNRAVDEICEALDAISASIRSNYFRIGSRYGTHPHFTDQLLESKISSIKSRKELLSVVQSHRIVVATVASINGKSELFQLKNFDRVIIDEASQLIEPNLIGLLPLFKRFVLIGDHKQLPAVVVQSEAESNVNNPLLKEIGLSNLRHSLFERLYKRCQENNWDWAFGCLTHQGRMHHEIMQFPSKEFYESHLKVMPSQQSSFQLQPLLLVPPSHASDLEQLLCQYRLLFLPTDADEGSKNYKTNRFEAEKAALIIRAFQRIYKANDLDFHANSLGVITPYRAQIAQIRHNLEEMNIPNDLITIDTVERYQGGARDIIILSLCTNKSSQMRSLSSLSDEGIDRKLNVALTRARKHLIILGNQRILNESPIYAKLLHFCMDGM